MLEFKATEDVTSSDEDEGQYIRRAGEYSRPHGRTTVALPGDQPIEVMVTGAWLYNDLLQQLEDMQPLDLELVPEPGNPWDSSAVSVDLGGRRVGYLPSDQAADWHDPLRFLNRLGYAAYMPGRMKLSRTGNPWIFISMPSLDGLYRVATRVGVFDQCDQLLSQLAPPIFTRLLENPDELSDEVALLLERKKGFAPDLSWSRDRNLSPFERLPQSVILRVENLARNTKQRAAEERAKIRAEQENERVRLAVVKAEKRAALRSSVEAGTKAGKSQTELAKELGCSVKLVAALQKESGAVPRGKKLH